MDYFSRQFTLNLPNRASSKKIHLIFGARQTGKSFFLRHIADSSSVYIDLQDRTQRLAFERNPSILSQQLQARTEKCLLVLVDEIQRVPSLLDEVQHLFDRHPNRFEFVLTGSSARKLKSSSANLLPGRSHVHRLTPLVLAERKDPVTSRVFPRPAPSGGPPGFPAARLEDLLVYGNLPGVVQEDPISRAKTLESYVELYLEEEIRREALVRNVGAFQQFLELAAVESGNLINLTALSQQSGVPVATLRTFYQTLEDTFVGYRVPAFGERTRKRILTTPKFIFFDLGVRHAAARLHFSDDLIRMQPGRLLENWVGLELIHRCYCLGRAYRVSFWRTAHHAEVDFVLETPQEVLPIEVKWTDAPRETDARFLKLFLATYPQKARRGFIVCRCPEVRQITPTIQAIPWSML